MEPSQELCKVETNLQRGFLVYPRTHSKGLGTELGSQAQARTGETAAQNIGHV